MIVVWQWVTQVAAWPRHRERSSSWVPSLDFVMGCNLCELLCRECATSRVCVTVARTVPIDAPCGWWWAHLARWLIGHSCIPSLMLHHAFLHISFYHRTAAVAQPFVGASVMDQWHPSSTISPSKILKKAVINTNVASRKWRARAIGLHIKSRGTQQD